MWNATSMTLIWIQLVLPIAMLLWIAFVPTPNRLAWMAQIGATAAVLAVLHFAGLWMMPPWWVPWVYWTLFIAALFRMQIPKAALPSTAPGWATALLWVVTTGGGFWLVADAVAGHQPPAGVGPDVAMPLAPGRYLVVNGGSRACPHSWQNDAQTTFISGPELWRRYRRDQSLGISDRWVRAN
jgi:hypothetical protein